VLHRSIVSTSPVTMSDGNIFKPDKDYTKDADKILPEAEELAKVNNMPHDGY